MYVKVMQGVAREKYGHTLTCAHYTHAHIHPSAHTCTHTHIHMSCCRANYKALDALRAYVQRHTDYLRGQTNK